MKIRKVRAAITRAIIAIRRIAGAHLHCADPLVRSPVKIIALHASTQTEHLIVVSMTNSAGKTRDDWITINDNGVESVTHMYTETRLVLDHNVATLSS